MKIYKNLNENENGSNWIKSISFYCYTIPKCCNKAKAIFVIDNSEEVGLGHLTRSLEVIGSYIELTGIIDIIIALPKPIKKEIQSLFCDELGNTPYLLRVGKLFDKVNIDLVKFIFIDSYKNNIQTEIYIRDNCNAQIYCFEDLHERPHSTETVIFHPSPQVKLSGPKIWGGLDFISVRNRIQKNIQIRKVSKGEKIKVLVYLSAAEIFNDLTQEIISYIRIGKHAHQIEIKLVGDFSKENKDKITEIIDAYKWADLCIGSCGVSFWERISICLPSIYFELADNQKQVMKYATKENIGFPIIGNNETIINLIGERVEKLAKNPDHIEKESIKLFNNRPSLIGARKIATIISET